MANKQFNDYVNKYIEEKMKPTKMNMVDFLNKHARTDNTILGYWFGDSLIGLTDHEILQKCAWLDRTKCSIIETLFGFKKFEEFVEDYEAVAETLGFTIDKGGAVWKK